MDEDLKKHLKEQLEIYRELMYNESEKSDFAKGKHRGFFFAYKSILDGFNPPNQ